MYRAIVAHILRARPTRSAKRVANIDGICHGVADQPSAAQQHGKVHRAYNVVLPAAAFGIRYARRTSGPVAPSEKLVAHVLNGAGKLLVNGAGAVRQPHLAF